MEIYGVDLDQPVTPIAARDAIVRCFMEAHCKDTGKVAGSYDPAQVEEYSKNIIKEGFQKNGEDFEHPTKQALLNIVGYLEEVVKKLFADPGLISKHKTEIMQILSVIPGEPNITPAS